MRRRFNRFCPLSFLVKDSALDDGASGEEGGGEINK